MSLHYILELRLMWEGPTYCGYCIPVGYTVRKIEQAKAAAFTASGPVSRFPPQVPALTSLLSSANWNKPFAPKVAFGHRDHNLPRTLTICHHTSASIIIAVALAVVLVLVSWNRVTPHSPECHVIHCVDQACIKFRDPPASVSKFWD